MARLLALCYWLSAGSIFLALPHAAAAVGGAPTIPFVDGLWHGEIEFGPNKSDFKSCWASTTFGDGTMFTLTKQSDGLWYLQLSNPSWQLPHSHRYAMVVLVDFYPRLYLAAEAKNQTLLEIADLDHISLLEFIEIGHTIDLASDGFHEKYDLEGSAKVIERIRNCFADQTSAVKPTTATEPGQ